MSDELILSCTLNKTHLPVMHTQQLVYVLIEAKPGADMALVRTPLNLSLVLDKSGSMQGDKIRNLRRAAKLAVDRLAPDDFVSIVAFSDKTYRIIESRTADDKDTLKAVIDKIKDGGGTAISGGMRQGIKELQKRLKEKDEMLKQANNKIATLKNQLCSLQVKQRTHRPQHVGHNGFKAPVRGKK